MTVENFQLLGGGRREDGEDGPPQGRGPARAPLGRESVAGAGEGSGGDERPPADDDVPF